MSDYYKAVDCGLFAIDCQSLAF